LHTENLKIEVSRMWKVMTKIVPVTNEALGKITNGLNQNLLLLPGHLSVSQLQ
jgi:hypothetical protein